MARLFFPFPSFPKWRRDQRRRNIRQFFQPLSTTKRSKHPLPAVHLESQGQSRHQSLAASAIQTEQNAIAIRHLHKIFDPEHDHPCHALDDVNLTIAQGTVQMIVGPSGAGKTTLLLSLAGLLSLTSGTLSLFGQPFSDLEPALLEQFRRQSIGVVFQESNLLRSLTALENVEAMLQFRGIHGRASHHQAQHLLTAMGLKNHWHHLPRQLSGGQQQRVSVARALAGYPPIILADEPTASLDFSTGRTVVELMRHIALEHQCTVVIATHDTRMIEVGDRVAYLNDGILQTDPSQSH